jgi:hypothetical protein
VVRNRDVILNEGYGSGVEWSEGEPHSECKHDWEHYKTMYGEPIKTCKKCKKTVGEVVYY